MANIIKLDEYLEKHHYNMVKAVTDALGMDPNDPKDIQYTMGLYQAADEQLTTSTEHHQLERDINAALEVHDTDRVKELLQVRDVDTWEGQTFDGVDIAEGFNYRCEMASESAKNGLMDWLEENSIEYLIDNGGNFAVKCPTRKQHYHVNRYVEHLSNKWDKPSFGKSVDPTLVKKSLGNISRPALSDNVNEQNIVQGPWKKKDPRDFHYEPQEPMTPELELKRRAASMNDEQLFDRAYRALETEMTLGQSGGNIDVALDYIVAGYEPEQNKILQGMRIALKDRYEDEFGQEYGTQQAWKHKTVGTDAIVRDEDVDEDEKDSTFHDTDSSISPFTNPVRDEDDEDDDDKKNESVMEGKKKKKKSDEQREKEAKAKLDDPQASAKAAGGEDPAVALTQGQFQPKTIEDKKKAENKKKGREKISMDEKINEGRIKELDGFKVGQMVRVSNPKATPKWRIDGFTNDRKVVIHNTREAGQGYPVKDPSKGQMVFSLDRIKRANPDIVAYIESVNESKIEEGVLGFMPTLGRMRELAGIQSEDCGSTPDQGMMTIVVKPDPGTPKIQNLPGIAEAKELMMKAFEIYNTLPDGPQGDFKDYMIGQMMGSTVGLKEGIEELIELERGKEPSKPMTENERVTLAKKIKEMRHALVHIIENWKVRTREVNYLEPVILLLKKLEARIGKGLI